ncbi:PREDICTED: solute carrier family 22 member 20-like [Nanorana parkeri]|uniref:solute carrier family 22 member 20-like n=1 Tax=Nanorana parkeri TaxID=125878 RepID=UPI0008544163|nr:PREDICTED: solute carrier family 22 member 20-like [Nanorana parkeri]
MAFNDILVSIGGVGCFQILHTILLLVPVALLSCHNLLQNFTGAVPDHHCKLPSSRVWNSQDETQLFDFYIPLDKDRKPQRCAQYQIVKGFLPNATEHQWEKKSTESCRDGWTYDRSVFSSTIVTEWNLVCNHHSLKQIARSIYMTGVLLGALVFGSLADKVGRMEILTWSYLQMGVAGSCAAFLPTFDAYCAFRFLCGVASSAISVNSISLILEWMPKHGRMLAGNFFGFSYSFGQLVLSAVAYKIRDWRWLQFAVSAPFCIFFIYSWWLPESARWLILRDEPEKALKYIQKVASVNGKHREGDKLTAQMLCSEMQKDILIISKSHSVFDLVRTPAMRRMSLSLIIVWFSSNFAYYGLSMDLKDFGLGVFIAQALFGGVEMIAKLLVMLVMTFVGRRVMQFASLFMAGIMVISYGFIPQDMKMLCTVLAVMGKAFLACAITCMYLYTGELYPTEIRQTGMGFSAMNARLGSAVASVLHLTGDFSFTILPMLFGITPIIAGFFSCFLFETKDSHLPDTINEVESRIKASSTDSEDSDDEDWTYKVHLKEIP